MVYSFLLFLFFVLNFLFFSCWKISNIKLDGNNVKLDNNITSNYDISKKEKNSTFFFFCLNSYMIIMDSNNISYDDNYYNIYLWCHLFIYFSILTLSRLIVPMLYWMVKISL